MKNLLLMLCLIALTTGCSESPNQKAAKLLKSEIGTTTDIQLDSIIDYPEAFDKRMDAIELTKMAHEKTEKSITYIKSIPENERNGDDFINYCSKVKEDVIALLNQAKDCNIKAAGIVFRSEMSSIEPEFIGWSYTHKTDSTETAYYFNKEISEILGIKRD